MYAFSSQTEAIVRNLNIHQDFRNSTNISDWALNGMIMQLTQPPPYVRVTPHFMLIYSCTLSYCTFATNAKWMVASPEVFADWQASFWRTQFVCCINKCMRRSSQKLI